MTKNIEDSQIQQKLKYIGLNLNRIPKFLKEYEDISYRASKMYDETNYKIYKYIDIDDIEILITPTDRLDDLSKKYKKASPIAEYLEPKSEENIEKYLIFIKMLENLDLYKLEKLEKEQELLNDKTPFEVKYDDNFIWQIYYSEVNQKYFMLFPANETRTESLFYLIKKKIELKKSKKKEQIYVPICHAEYKSDYLKKSEISDLENYLWLFTNQWPSIYEKTDKIGKTSIEIVGKTNVYEKIKSTYKITLNSKEEAQNEYKLIKALFILQSYDEELYKFKTNINKDASLEFCYNLRKITYDNLADFISEQVVNKYEDLNNILNQLLLQEERLEILKEAVEKQNREFLLKEKQIVTFLECKKTFFGRVKYFFKGKNKKKKINDEVKEDKKNKKVEKEEKLKFETKDFYNIEDLLKICKSFDSKQTEYKNVQMDIKALENKKENLERKIKNATLYINEIESHKKSIFDFWKFTSKDEINLLNESEEKQQLKETKIKKSFNYEEDIDEFGKNIDEKQRIVFSKNECDAVYAILNDLESFNIVGKEKKLKKDDAKVLKNLNQMKKEYEDNIEEIKKKDFDIFGNVIEDKTKIKVLKNNKHREIEKDKFKLLNVKLETTLEEYEDNINNYYNLLKEAYGKMNADVDFGVYKLDTEELIAEGFKILNMNPELEIENSDIKEDVIKLIRLDIKENMPVIFYSNIMFYDNLNDTLPLGMDISNEVLVNLNMFEFKLISRKDFNISLVKDNFQNEIKTIQVYEYSLERKLIQ